MVSLSEKYQAFLDVQAGEGDGLPKDKATTATKKQIGWWKQYQMTRAITHARAGKATPEELRYLAKHGQLFYPNTPKHLRPKPSTQNGQESPLREPVQ